MSNSFSSAFITLLGDAFISTDDVSANDLAVSISNFLTSLVLNQALFNVSDTLFMLIITKKKKKIK